MPGRVERKIFLGDARKDACSYVGLAAAAWRARVGKTSSQFCSRKSSLENPIYLHSNLKDSRSDTRIISIGLLTLVESATDKSVIVMSPSQTCAKFKFCLNAASYFSHSPSGCPE